MPCAAVWVIHDQLSRSPSQPAYGVAKRMEDEGNIIDLEVVLTAMDMLAPGAEAIIGPIPFIPQRHTASSLSD